MFDFVCLCVCVCVLCLRVSCVPVCWLFVCLCVRVCVFVFALILVFVFVFFLFVCVFFLCVCVGMLFGILLCVCAVRLVHRRSPHLRLAWISAMMQPAVVSHLRKSHDALSLVQPACFTFQQGPRQHERSRP